ncbi:MAG: glycosyltransferase, partial [Kiritimatiellae bacterium]|nr:glycosyltransferase [Kiritimatiellia bacterium]
MKTVKLLWRNIENAPKEEVAFGGCRFVVDAALEEYDWLAVYDELPRDWREHVACPLENTVLMTVEPVSIKHYNSHYLRQFAHVLTNQPPEAIRHPGYRLGRGYFKWMNNRTFAENLAFAPPEKTKTISAVCSAKQMRFTKHHARFRLVETLAREIPGLDWFGWGVKKLERKFDALDAYKYHVAVENHIAPGHWSEKIADAFLSWTLPFYAGDPTLGEVLPPESFIPIPIDDPEAATAIVRDAIATNQYEKRLEAICEARRLLLEKYNFYAQIAELVNDCDVGRVQCAGGATIRERRLVRNSSICAAMEDLLWKV